MSVGDRKRQGEDFVSFGTLEKLLEISQALILVRDLESLLQKIAESAGGILGADVIVLYEYREEIDDVIVPPIIWGDIRVPEVLREIGHVRPHKESAVFNMLERTEPFYAPNAREDWARLIEDRPPEEGESGNFIYREGIASSAAVRLKAEEERVGVLFVNYRAPCVFHDKKRRIIELFATQAAIAIRNARLFNETQEQVKQLHALVETAQVINRFTALDSILEPVFEQAFSFVGKEVGWIALVDHETQILRIIASRGIPQENIDAFHKRPTYAHEGTFGIVMQTGEMQEIPDAQHDARVSDIGLPIPKQLTNIPLKVEDQVIGILTLDALIPNEQARQSLIALADMTTVAIRNSHLFEKVEKREETLEKLLQVGQEMGRLALQEPKGALAQIARSVCEELEADCAVIYPYDRTRKEYFDTSNVASYGLWHPLVLADKPREGGMAARIRQAGMLEISDRSQEDPRLSRPLMKREGIQAIVGVSLRADDEELGVLYVNFRQPHQILEDERKVIRKYADKAIDILKGHRVTGIQLPALLGQIVQNAKELLEADLVILYQYHRGRDEEFVTPPVVAGELREPDSMRRKIYDDDVPAILAREGRSYYADDVTKEELLSKISPMVKEHDGQPGRPRFIVREGVRSSAGVLLRAEGEIVGVMFINYRTSRPFTEEIRRTIDLFANQAAIAIQSARIFEQTRTLQEIGQEIAVATLEPERIFDLILERALGLVGFSKGWISLLDSTTGVLQKRAARGLNPDEWRPLEKGKGVTGHVAETGEYMNVPDVSKVPLYEPTFEDTRSELCVPLKYQNRVLGVLNLESPRLAAFTRRDEEVMMTMASGAAIAIQNARLLEIERTRATQLAVVNQVARRIASILELDQLLREVVTAIQQSFNYYHVGLFLLDEAAGELELQAVAGAFADVAPPDHRLALGEGMVGWTAETGQSHLANDVSQEPRYVLGILKEALTQSELCVPLKLPDQVIGVLDIQSSRLNAFDKMDLMAMETLADQLTVAIENARLYTELGQRVKQLEVLPGIYKKIIAVGIEGIDRILDLLYGEASEVLDLSNAQVQIAFYDEAKDEVSFPLAIEQNDGEIIDVVRWSKREEQYRKADEDEVVEQFKPRKWRAPPGLNEYVIRKNEPLLIVEDFEQKAVDLGIRVWPMFGRLDRPTHSWLGVPMMVGGRVVGVISIQSLEQERAFDEEQQKLLVTVANQAAVAIENARLYKRSEAARKQAQSAQASLRAMAGGYVHRLNGALGFIPASIDAVIDGLSADTQDILRDVKGGVVDALDFTKRMTDLVVDQELPRESVDMNLILRAVVHRFKIPSTKVGVTWKFASDLPEIMADKMFLTEVFNNMVLNALEAMEDKPEGELRIGGSLLADTKEIEIWLSDTGCGISQENLPKIFEPEFTTKPGKRGLGLWFCDTVIKAHGGRITADSTQGIGTTFTLTLPVGGE